MDGFFSVQIWKIREGYYGARLMAPTLPKWSNETGLPLPELVRELNKLGCHPVDIGDALHEMDPNWRSTPAHGVYTS
jgi:hypothetical protein